MTKAPIVGLRSNQQGRDTLPEYTDLDAKLAGLGEQGRCVDERARDWHRRDIVFRTENMLFGPRYTRRRGAPPGVKTSSRSVGRDRWYPITNQFRER